MKRNLVFTFIISILLILACIFLLNTRSYSKSRTTQGNNHQSKSFLGNRVSPYHFSKSRGDGIEMRKSFVSRIVESLEEEPF